MTRLIVNTSIVLLLFINPFSVRTDAETVSPSTEKNVALLWHDIRSLDVEGKGWTDTKSFYDRLPAKAEAIVRKPVWNLSRDSAGICIWGTQCRPSSIFRVKYRSANIPNRNKY